MNDFICIMLNNDDLFMFLTADTEVIDHFTSMNQVKNIPPSWKQKSICNFSSILNRITYGVVRAGQQDGLPLPAATESHYQFDKSKPL
jgi:hypothetical protein